MFNPLNLITKFIKSSNQKELDRIGKILEKINSLYKSNAAPRQSNPGPKLAVVEGTVTLIFLPTSGIDIFCF